MSIVIDKKFVTMKRMRCGGLTRLVMLCTAVCSAVLLCCSDYASRSSYAGRYVELREWEYCWPREGKGDACEWRKAPSLRDPPGRNGAEIVWLRTRLPHWKGNEASLFFPAVYQDFEVLHDDKPVYRWGSPDPKSPARYLSLPWHIIPIDGGGGTILVKVRSSYRRIGIAGIPLLGSRSVHLARIIRANILRTAVSFIFAVAGLFAIVLYARHRDEVALAAFGCTLVLMAVWNVAESSIKQVLFDAPLAWLYAEHGSLYLTPVSIGIFIERLFGAGPYRLVRRGWQVHLAYAVLGILAGAVNPSWLREWILTPFQIMMALYLILISAVIVMEARRGDLEARIAAGGIIVAIGFGIYDLAVAFFELGFAYAKISYWGLLIFMAMIGIALDRRIRISPARLTEFRKIPEDVAPPREAEITPEMKEKLERAIAYMKDHFTEDISREGLAGLVGLNHDYFGKMFRLYTGKKVGAYLNEMRVRMAAELLTSTDQPISAVAFDVGFESLATFYRVFQLVTGLSPTAYRERFRNDIHKPDR